MMTLTLPVRLVGNLDINPDDIEITFDDSAEGNWLINLAHQANLKEVIRLMENRCMAVIKTILKFITGI